MIVVKGRRGFISEDFTQTEFFREAVLPGSFAPPAHDVFADAVELLVAGYQVEDPAGKDVDVGVAVGGQQANAAVLV